MIELVSVEAKNFRSFGDTSFTPLGAGQGLTAINGANGTGKSSIATHALLWCLYGVTPDGVNVKSLRRQNSEGEVVVAVTFRHNGQDVRVERSLRGKNDTTVASVTVDGVEQTNISARTATAWVEQRLGIDAEAFLTAFVVRQKEVDSLVRARPAERRALIERLAGIDRLSAALSKAREAARRLSAVANAINVDVDLDTAKQQADAAQRQHREARDTADRLRLALTEANERLDQAKDTAETAESAVADLTEKEKVVAELRVHAMAAERERDRLLTESEGADRLADVEAAIVDCRAALTETQQSVSHAETAKRQAEQANEQAARERATAQQRHSEEQRLRDAATQAEQDTALDVDSLVEEAERWSAAAAQQRTAAGIAAAEADRLRAVIDTLRSHTDASCPTCQQPLHDTDALLSGLDVDVARRDSEAAKAYAAAEHADTQHQAVKQQLEQWRQAAEHVRALKSQWQQAYDAATEQEERAAAAEETSETLAEEAHAAVQAAADAADTLPSLQQEERQLQTALRKAEAAQEAAENVPEAERVARDVTHRLNEALTALEEAQKRAGGVSAERARKALQDAHSDAKAASEAYSRAATDAALAEATATSKLAALQAAETAIESKKAALRDAETAAAVASSLEEFRLDRLSRLAPELSEVASDIIATMTEGRYSAIELDEDFTPIVTEAATGQQRPVAWLSGGEESAVALALRLAIGDVVAGQNVGVLILDEVLAAHDRDRRAAVMTAIRSLPHRQVITINHASEATDQVDLIAHVTPTEDGAVIDHQAGESVGAITLLDDEPDDA